MNEFKDVLKYLRTKENLSQLELAQKLNMSKSAISMYEVGQRKPDYDTLEVIADFFNVDMNFLLGRDDRFLPENAILAAKVAKTPELRNLVKIYLSLNETGQNKLLDNALDLSKIYKT